MADSWRGWDFPTRAFHWGLVLLVVFSFVTGKVGGSWLEWHMRSGYTILALLVFRLAWGVVGSREARFASFVRGPRAALDHARQLRRGSRELSPGHNPLGGWMIVAMLALLAFQAGTGLFSNDESSHQGPLAAKASEALVDRMSSLHSWNEYLILAAVAIHVIAISVYQWRWRMDVVGPMWRGRSRAGENLRAAVLLAMAAAAVYALVVVYPR